ncbi:MAG TPA: heavy-metal-associated domain-containing protein [Hyphomicrobiaceae bacterium]|nr:heavy-metal-associated domain-containing protein [Hyphomicrobiaceae bacterium]
MTNTLAFKVPNMDCGHCAGTIKTAVEKAHPGAKVDADPKSKRVVVTGASDREKVAATITAAGYTPEAA